MANRKYSLEQKEMAVKMLETGDFTGDQIAERFGTHRRDIYRWREQLRKEENPSMPKKYRANYRRIWDVIPDDGITLDDLNIALSEPITKHGLRQACDRLIKKGFLRKQKGLVIGNEGTVTYFREDVDPPAVRDDYRPKIERMARTGTRGVDSKATMSLMDEIETCFLELNTGMDRLSRLVDSIRGRLITDDVITELQQLRTLRDSVQALTKK